MMTTKVHISGYAVGRAEEILTEGALALVADLHRSFNPTRLSLLARRSARRSEVAHRRAFESLPETRQIREDPWRVAPAPADLTNRRVEITGPTERKMAINALNSGADVWLADFEDALAPTWANVLAGQVNLIDAVERTIRLTTAEGREYRLSGERPAIVVRPRGWHLDERHLLVDGQPAVAALVDFGLYFFHNAARLLEQGSGPYFYLPKMESRLEARLWNDVFNHAQEVVGIPSGTIRATALIETIPAAFEMDEILFELREHASGLNAGRWDYLFSIIKHFRDQGRDFLLPNRNEVTMTAPMMRAYTELLVKTCHRRGAFAMGGMAAFVPSRRDPEINATALANVRRDKQREANDGFDGSWVAHPDLVPVCREAFDEVLGDRPNQLERQRHDVSVRAPALLDVRATPGEISEAGLRNNVSVALQYLESWLRGQGAVAIFNLMEDVATAEIARCQVWQWVNNDVKLADGRTVTVELVRAIADQELSAIRGERSPEVFSAGRWEAARAVFEEVALGEQFTEFLTHVTYPLID